MLSSLLCGANAAAAAEPQPPTDTASVPASPPLTGDYRVRPRMSSKRTNTAGSLRTLVGKKSRDSFFCSGAQELEQVATDASKAASEASGHTSRRWWRSDKDKEGSVRLTPLVTPQSHHQASSSASSSASFYSPTSSTSSPLSLYSGFSPVSSPSTPPSPRFAPLSRLSHAPHPFADTSVSASPQSYFDLPSRPDSVRSRTHVSSFSSHASSSGNINSLGLRLDLSCLSSHSELRAQPAGSPPTADLPRLPTSSYDPSKRSSIESTSASETSPPKSVSPLPPSWELAHPLQTEGSGATWRPELTRAQESSRGDDRTLKAVRVLAQTLLAKLNLSTVYLCRVPVPSSAGTAVVPQEEDMTSLMVYQAGCSALPSRRASTLLHARTLKSSSGAIIYRRPPPEPSSAPPASPVSAASASSSADSSSSAHASGVLVEVLAGPGQNGERLVLAGFVTDPDRKLGGEEVAVCKRVAAEVARLLRKEERRVNSN